MPGYKILCVDDESIALAYLNKLCTKINPENTVATFANPPQALEYARNNQIDVALLDIEMPKLNGLYLAQELRRLYPNINIILITAYEDYALHAFKLDCSGYLIKPIEEEELRHQFAVLRFKQQDIKYPKDKLIVKCFGEFEVYYLGVPLIFKHKRTKEVFAYLIDRQCSTVTNQKIISAIWEDDEDHSSYFKNLRTDLITTLAAIPFQVLNTPYGSMSLVADAISCDYFDYLKGINTASFTGEYMEQYSWGEPTKATLAKKYHK